MPIDVCVKGVPPARVLSVSLLVHVLRGKWAT